MEIRIRLGCIALALLLACTIAQAQTLSAPTLTNLGDGYLHTDEGLLCDAERAFTLGTVTSSATNFRVRYQQILASDCAEVSGPEPISMSSSYRVQFNATCPVGYRLTVNTQRRGALIANREGSNDYGFADLSAVSGSSSPGITTGSLGLADLAAVSSGGGTCAPFNQTGGATLVGVSNDAPVSHQMTFSWTGSVDSEGFAFNSGDEGCVLMGLTVPQGGSDFGNFSADDYPNPPGCAGNPRDPALDGHFADVTLACLCGDGVNDGAGAGEDCDDGALNGSAGSCCTTSCKFKTAGTACTSDGNVCTLDQCNGVSAVCQHPAGNAGAECRVSAGVCDPAEMCDGVGTSCPMDAKSPNGTACTDDGNVCTVDQCDGSSNACQHTAAPGGTVCRASTGECDPQETCSGTSCPGDTMSMAGTACTADGNPCTLDQCNGVSGTCQHPAGNFGATCRTATGECDQAETCDGVSTSCPADAFVGAGTSCTDSTPADCFDAQCNGSGTCLQAHGFETASYVCRAASGLCDTAEQCTGSSGTCPSDEFALAGTECRSAASDCDQSEVCTGASASCPPDDYKPIGQSCPDTSPNDCFAAQCNGAGACNQTQGLQAASYECRPAAGECDVTENCLGDSGVCPANSTVAAGTPCTDSNTADCFDAQCDGSGSCSPTQGIESAAHVCRPSTGECDPQEACDGVTGVCPNEVFASAGTACTDVTPIDCFDARCNGAGACDQQQTLESSSYVCRNAADICDQVETCDGLVGACPADGFKGTDVVCRPPANPDCDVAESCTGSGITCPANGFVANGFACNDHNGCTTVDTCQTGVCTGGSPRQDCQDGIACTDDVCTSTGDTTFSCSNPISNNRCLIDGSCHTSHALNLANDCQRCDPGATQTAWSNLAQHETCADSFGLCNGAGGCEEPLAVCPDEPVPPGGCRAAGPGRAKVAIRDAPPDKSKKDSIAFTWTKGAATLFSDFGNPVRSTNYALCIYDGAGDMRRQLQISAGGVCKIDKPCWRSASNKKYIYKDGRDQSLLSNDGVTSIKLLPGSQGKAKLTLKSKGVHVQPPLLPIGKPIIVQLINGRGECFGATFSSSGAKKDEGFAFVGVSD